MGWSECLPPRNTQRVVIGNYSLERNKDSKTGFSYVRTPKSVLLDELAYLMPEGQIIPVSVGKKGKVDLAFQSAKSVIDSCTYDGASTWNPVKPKAAKEAAQFISQDCSSHPGFVDLHEKCLLCSQNLLVRISMIRGFCEACRMVYQFDKKYQGVLWAG
jgi:hypothetical protein